MIQAILRRLRRTLLGRRPSSLGVLAAAILCLAVTYLVLRLRTLETAAQLTVSQVQLTISVDDPTIDWTNYAYVQYATSPDNLCKAVMLFSELAQTSSLGLRVLYYPDDWIIHSNFTKGNEYPQTLGQLLSYAADEFRVILQPTHSLHGLDELSASARLRLNLVAALNQTEYERVIVLGFESSVRNQMDELFFLPSAPLAVPYAYWPSPGGPRGRGRWEVSDQLLVIQPDMLEAEYVEQQLLDHRPAKTTAEEIRRLYGSSFSSKPASSGIHQFEIFQQFEQRNSSLILLPQRPYHLLTHEFRLQGRQHATYLGPKSEPWDPEEALREAKLVHFWDRDLGVPSPWTASNAALAPHVPNCVATGTGENDCGDAWTWTNLYAEYWNRRRNVCGPMFNPPDQTGRMFNPE